MASAGPSAAASSSGSAIVRPVPTNPRAIRVFGGVDVRRLPDDNLRERLRAETRDMYRDEMDHLRRLLTFEKDRWKRLGATEPRQVNQLPSFWYMDEDTIESVKVMGRKWKTAYNRRIRACSLIPTHQRIKGLNMDAILDMYLELGAHFDILIQFSHRFKVAALQRDNWANCRESFRNFTRLPPEDCARVVDCMRTIVQHELEDMFLEDYPDMRRWFIGLFHDDYDRYNLYRTQYNNAIDGNPPGEAHHLEFMSEDDYYAFRPEMQENPRPPRTHMGQHAVTLFDNPGDDSTQVPVTFMRFVPDMSDIGRTNVTESKHLKAVLDVELERTRERHTYISPAKVQHEALAAVVLPSASTTFIGSSSSFARLYRTLSYMQPSRLIECFDVNPVLKQFESLIYWTLWQMFSHTRIWYAGFLFDDELDAITEQTIEFKEPVPTLENSSSAASFDVAINSYRTRAREFRRNEYHSRLFAFPVSITFEDVIASVPWANSIQATRQAMFDAFPPEFVTEHFDHVMPDYSDGMQSHTDRLQEAFDKCWTHYSPSAQQLDCLNARFHVGALVDAVVRFVTFSQIIEHTTHLRLDAAFLGLLTIWQFASTPKVNVLKYVIERIRPNGASVQFMRRNSNWVPPAVHNFVQMGIDLPFASKVWIGIFMQYAKWLKHLANLRATLMVTNLLPALNDGIGNPNWKPGNPSHLRAIPSDMIDGSISLFLGLSVTDKIDSKRLATQEEFKALHMPGRADTRLQAAFIQGSYDPFQLPNRSSYKMPSESIATVRSSSDAALGESTSARPPKRQA